MNKTLVIIGICLVDLILSFFDNFLTLSVSMGFLLFYGCLWIRVSVFLVIINHLCRRYLELNSVAKNVLFWYSILTQYFFAAWVWGQYIQLKEYL